VAAPIDRAFFKLSPRWLDAPLRRTLPTLMLATTGRKTGKTRVSPLLYVEEGDGWAVVATNWGRPHHPAWSANLLADPVADVGFGDHTVEITSRLVEDDEFPALWDRFVEIWPGFNDYRSRIDRTVRMFLLEPR